METIGNSVLFDCLIRRGDLGEALDRFDETSGAVFVGLLRELLDFSQHTDDDEQVGQRTKKLYIIYDWLSSTKIKEKSALSVLSSAVLDELKQLEKSAA